MLAQKRRIYADRSLAPVKKQVTIAKNAIDACRSAEAVVIATEWKEFKEIEWKDVYSRMNKPAFLFDGRLLVDAEKLREIGFKVRFLSLFISPCLGLTVYRLGRIYRPRGTTLEDEVGRINNLETLNLLINHASSSSWNGLLPARLHV
jgi:hypothetical protein